MGSSLSKTKIFDVPKQHRFSCSTTSSERTMVEPEKTNKKPSLLTKNHFFHTKKSNVKSLSKRKHYKRKSVVTKSIIGKPTNFKVCIFKGPLFFFFLLIPQNIQHLNSSTHMDDDDEVTKKIACNLIIQIAHFYIPPPKKKKTAKIAAQMLILSSLIKPLPMEGNIPIIPPRVSSYNSHLYAKDIPATTSPSIKKKKKVVGMKNSVPRRRVQARATNKMS